MTRRTIEELDLDQAESFESIVADPMKPNWLLTWEGIFKCILMSLAASISGLIIGVLLYALHDCF